MEQENIPEDEDVILDTTHDGSDRYPEFEVTDLRTGDQIHVPRGKAVATGGLVKIVDSITGNVTFIPTEHIRIDRKGGHRP